MAFSLLMALVGCTVIILVPIAIGRIMAHSQIRRKENSDWHKANLRAENADLRAENDRLRDELERLQVGTDKKDPPDPGIIAGHAN